MTNAAFWAGTFGDDYIDRNNAASSVAARTAQFSKILSSTQNVTSITELGANIGLNLLALRALLPQCALSAVEINAKAFARLKTIEGVQAINGSLLESEAPVSDLSFTAGVLIHIGPADLPVAYRRLVEASRRYVLVAEYFNPVPVEVPYRGHAGKMFKRDWAGELLDTFPLRLVDYGFFYSRDPACDRDDVNWFLMEKT